MNDVQSFLDEVVGYRKLAELVHGPLDEIMSGEMSERKKWILAALDGTFFGTAQRDVLSSEISGQDEISDTSFPMVWWGVKKEDLQQSPFGWPPEKRPSEQILETMVSMVKIEKGECDVAQLRALLRGEPPANRHNNLSALSVPAAKLLLAYEYARDNQYSLRGTRTEGAVQIFHDIIIAYVGQRGFNGYAPETWGLRHDAVDGALRAVFDFFEGCASSRGSEIPHKDIERFGLPLEIVDMYREAVNQKPGEQDTRVARSAILRLQKRVQRDERLPRTFGSVFGTDDTIARAPEVLFSLDEMFTGDRFLQMEGGYYSSSHRLDAAASFVQECMERADIQWYDLKKLEVPMIPDFRLLLLRGEGYTLTFFPRGRYLLPRVSHVPSGTVLYVADGIPEACSEISSLYRQKVRSWERENG